MAVSLGVAVWACFCILFVLPGPLTYHDAPVYSEHHIAPLLPPGAPSGPRDEMTTIAAFSIDTPNVVMNQSHAIDISHL